MKMNALFVCTRAVSCGRYSIASSSFIHVYACEGNNKIYIYINRGSPYLDLSIVLMKNNFVSFHCIHTPSLINA